MELVKIEGSPWSWSFEVAGVVPGGAGFADLADPLAEVSQLARPRVEALRVLYALGGAVDRLVKAAAVVGSFRVRAGGSSTGVDLQVIGARPGAELWSAEVEATSRVRLVGALRAAGPAGRGVELDESAAALLHLVDVVGARGPFDARAHVCERCAAVSVSTHRPAQLVAA